MGTETKEHDVQKDNLVFQGGSIKGAAYPGALSALQKNGFDLKKVKRIAGTSAGAITAALLAVGYSGEGLRDEINALDFSSFLDETKGHTHGLLFGIVEDQKKGGSKISTVSKQSVSHPSAASEVSSRLSNALGVYDGEKLRLLVEDRLYVKTGIHHLTFQELHELRLKDPEKYKDLFVTGVNLSTGYAEIFNYLRTPDMIISDAVRISLSIPLLFKPHTRYVKVKEALDDKQRVPANPVHVYTDGGLLDNYPVGIFDFAGFMDETINEKDPLFWQAKHNSRTLGFRLMSKQHIDYFAGNQAAEAKDITSLLPYFKALIRTVMNKENSDHQLKGSYERTICIDHLDIDTLAFNLSDKQRDALFGSGEKAVNDYFQSLAEVASTHVEKVRFFGK